MLAAIAEPSTDLHVSAPVGGASRSTSAATEGPLHDEEIGYDDQEYLAGVRAVASPIVDGRGRRVACLMVVGFKERPTSAR